MPSIVGTTGAQQSAVTNGYIEGALPSTVIDVLSKEIIYNALPEFVFMQFARRQRELEKMPGDTIKIHRFDPIRKGKRLNEGVPIEPKTMSASVVEVKVHEYGNAIDLTSRLMVTSAFDILMNAVKQLSDDYAITTEVEFVKTLLGLPSVLYPNDRDSRVGGADPLQAADRLDARTIRVAVEIQKNKKVPPFVVANPFTGGTTRVYVCFVNTAQARALREDPEYKADVRPNDAPRIFLGEIGMYEKVVFIESTLVPYIADSGAAIPGAIFIDNENHSDSNVVDDTITPDPAPAGFRVNVAFMIGDWTYGFAEAMAPQLAADPPRDLGRNRTVGWTSFQGTDLVNIDHGLKIETA